MKCMYKYAYARVINIAVFNKDRINLKEYEYGALIQLLIKIYLHSVPVNFY